MAIVVHLLGVMVAPITTPPRFEGPPSVIGAKLKEVYQPYMTALYLDHAYKFFAPNPGDSHLLRYDLYFADGTSRKNRDDQVFPDRRRHWPRLLYHRHFMLSEFVNDFAPDEVWRAPTNTFGNTSGPPAIPRPAEVAPAGRNQGGELIPSAPIERPGPPHVHVYFDGIARYLAKRHGAVRVDLYYRKHLLPTMEDFRRFNGKLDVPDSYLDRLIVSYEAEPQS
jgi:hypothetical protein